MSEMWKNKSFDFEGLIDKTVNKVKEIPTFCKKVNKEIKKTSIYQDFKGIDFQKIKSFLLKKW